MWSSTWRVSPWIWPWPWPLATEYYVLITHSFIPPGTRINRICSCIPSRIVVLCYCRRAGSRQATAYYIQHQYYLPLVENMRKDLTLEQTVVALNHLTSNNRNLVQAPPDPPAAGAAPEKSHLFFFLCLPLLWYQDSGTLPLVPTFTPVGCLPLGIRETRHAMPLVR